MHLRNYSSLAFWFSTIRVYPAGSKAYIYPVIYSNCPGKKSAVSLDAPRQTNPICHYRFKNSSSFIIVLAGRFALYLREK